LSTVEELMEVDKQSGVRKKLDELCSDLTEQIGKLSMRLNAHYFSHSTYHHQGSKDSFQFEV